MQKQFSIVLNSSEILSSPLKEVNLDEDKNWTEEKLNPTWEDQGQYLQHTDNNEQTYATMVNEETIDSINLDEDKNRSEDIDPDFFYSDKAYKKND